MGFYNAFQFLSWENLLLATQCRPACQFHLLKQQKRKCKLYLRDKIRKSSCKHITGSSVFLIKGCI